MCVCEREREIETERQRDRETERQRDRETESENNFGIQIQSRTSRWVNNEKGEKLFSKKTKMVS